MNCHNEENTEISPSIALQNVKMKLKEFSKKQKLNQGINDFYN